MTKKAVIVGTGITASKVYEFLKDSRGDNDFEILFIECGNFKETEKWSEDTEQKQFKGKRITVNSPFKVNPKYDQPIAKIENIYSNWRFDYNMKLGFGGSGTRWGGNIFRYFKEDFVDDKNENIFPFSYKDIVPYYELIESQFQVCGNSAQPYYPWPDSKYEYPAFHQTYADLEISSILKDEYNSFVKPMAVKRFGKNSCKGSRTCVESCPNNALVNPLKISMSEARKDPQVSFLYNSVCTFLEFDNESGSITHCNIYRDGKNEKISGDLFFICSNTIETIRILHNSRRVNEQKNKAFMPETHDLIGRYWGSHLNVTGWIECDFPLYVGRGKVMNSFLLKKNFEEKKNNILRNMLEIHNFPCLPEGDFSFDYKVTLKNAINHMFADDWGTTLRDKLKRLNYGVRLNFVSEMKLSANKSIVLSDLVDDSAFPLAQNRYEPTNSDVETLEFLKNELIGFANNQSIVSSGWNGWGLNGNHPIGGYRMSINPSKGVVGVDSFAHDHPNLALFGGGVLCSTSCVNPTLTISAITKFSLDKSKMKILRYLS